MPTRQDRLLDAAVAVLGTQGVRQLTHRAVDAAAGLPAGSASNCFRTRDALLTAVVGHIAAREKTAWTTIAAVPATPDELAAALAAFVRQATGPDRVPTLARHSLLVEAALRPALQAQLAATAAEIRTWGAQWLRELGSADPLGACRLLLDHLDGVILHQLAFPDPGFDPLPGLTTVVRAVTPRRRGR